MAVEDGRASEILLDELLKAIADGKTVDALISGIDFPIRVKDATSSGGVLKLQTDQLIWHVRESQLLAINFII